MTANTPERPRHRSPHSTNPKRRSPAPVRAVSLAFLLSFLAIAMVAAQSSTPEATPSASPTPSPDMPRLELELEELNDSGINGTVTLYDAGDDVIVEFDVEGAGGDHPSHIHGGVCGELEPEPAFPLENVDEEGASITAIDTTLDDLLADDFAVDMHLSPDQLGTLIACADIEGEPTVPEDAPTATPDATPDTTPAPVSTPDDDVAVGGTIEVAGTDGTDGAEATDDQIAQADEPATEPEEPAGTDVTVPTQDPVEVVEPTEPATVTEPADPADLDGTGGPVAEMPTAPQVPVDGDGTAGVPGKEQPGVARSLPQQAGVGSALAWPDSPATTVIWASTVGAVILGVTAWIIRRGEHQTTTTPSRWTRLGI